MAGFPNGCSMRFFGNLSGKSTYIFFSLVITLTGFVSYYLRDVLLSPESVSSVVGPQEGYYWTVAQYQISYERLENQILLYSIRKDKSFDEIWIRHQILESKFQILSSPSDLTSFFKNIPEYQVLLKKIALFMLQLDIDISSIRQGKTSIENVLSRFESTRDVVNILANNVRHAEIQQRDEVLGDFYKKRGLVYMGCVLLAGVIFCWIGMLLINGLRYKQLLLQQSKALDAERESVRAKNSFLGALGHE
ncbi:MAG: hypothetical protein IT497_00470 [Ottowia sp.]|nr:hypothetical protein [Ottowia sp.]